MRERDYLYTIFVFFLSMIRLVALYGVRSSTSKAFLRLNRSSFFLRCPSSWSFLRKPFLSKSLFSSINSFKLAKRVPSRWLAQLFKQSNQPWWLKADPKDFLLILYWKMSNQVKFFEKNLPISCISSAILPPLPQKKKHPNEFECLRFSGQQFILFSYKSMECSLI